MRASSSSFCAVTPSMRQLASATRARASSTGDTLPANTRRAAAIAGTAPISLTCAASATCSCARKAAW